MLSAYDHGLLQTRRTFLKGLTTAGISLTAGAANTIARYIGHPIGTARIQVAPLITPSIRFRSCSSSIPVQARGRSR